MDSRRNRELFILGLTLFLLSFFVPPSHAAVTTKTVNSLRTGQTNCDGTAVNALPFLTGATGSPANVSKNQLPATFDCAPSCGACNAVSCAGTCGGQASTDQCGNACTYSCAACYCGDGLCNSGENCSSCAGDCGGCGPVCGNSVCESGENCSNCSGDCGACCNPNCDPCVVNSGDCYQSCTDGCGGTHTANCGWRSGACLPNGTMVQIDGVGVCDSTPCCSCDTSNYATDDASCSYSNTGCPCGVSWCSGYAYCAHFCA